MRRSTNSACRCRSRSRWSSAPRRWSGRSSSWRRSRTATTGSILAPDPYGAHRDKIGQQFFSDARAASPAPIRSALGLADFEGAKRRATTAGDARSRALGKGHRRGRARAAADRARRDPLAEAQSAAARAEDRRRAWRLSHAAISSYDDDGDIRAILDWEMAHLGDPLEDLGWAHRSALGASAIRRVPAA